LSSPLVVLILVLMWVAVLLPPHLRNRGGSGSGNSMNSFRRKLDTLERSTPFPGANGHVSPYLPVNSRPVAGPQPLDGPLPAGSRHPLQGSGPRLVPMPRDGQPVAGAEPESESAYLLAPAPDLEPSWNDPVSEPVREGRVPAGVASARAARKRRRDVLFTLMAASGITLVMGLVLGTPLLFIHLLCDVALGGYVYLLVSMQKSKAERDIKVAFLPHQNAEAEPTRLLESGGGWQPGSGELLRRSAN
jgi:hypothetical protein